MPGGADRDTRLSALACVLAWAIGLVLATGSPLVASDPCPALVGWATLERARVERSAESLRGWVEDLWFVADQLERLHPGVHETVDRRDFERVARSIECEIPYLADDEILVRLKQLVALVPDNHTSSTSFDRRLETTTWFPLRTVELADGVFVLAASAEHAAVVGLEVVSMGGLPIERVLARVASVIAADSDLGVLRRRPLELMSPHVLHGLGIADSRDRLRLTVRARDRQELTVEVAAVPGEKDTTWYKRSYGVPTPDSVTLFDGLTELPVALSRNGEIHGVRPFYWLESLPEAGALYARISRTLDAEGESLTAFIERLWCQVDRTRPERLILDLRENTGGNHFLGTPLVHGVLERPWINRPESLFVLMGRGTFSAGTALAVLLDKETRATTIGEPTPQRPNFYAEGRAVTAPNHLFRVEISRHRWVHTWPWDRRPYLAPDIPVRETLADLVSGHDRAFELALKSDGFLPVDDLLDRVLAEQGPAAATAAYHRHKADYPDVWTTTEAAVNRLGYRLLAEDRPAAALVAFRLNVESYPDSANAWDSLGEALLEEGQSDEALDCYQKALALDPDNPRIEQVVAALQDG